MHCAPLLSWPGLVWPAVTIDLSTSVGALFAPRDDEFSLDRMVPRWTIAFTAPTDLHGEIRRRREAPSVWLAMALAVQTNPSAKSVTLMTYDVAFVPDL